MTIIIGTAFALLLIVSGINFAIPGVQWGVSFCTGAAQMACLLWWFRDSKHRIRDTGLGILLHLFLSTVLVLAVWRLSQ